MCKPPVGNWSRWRLFPSTREKIRTAMQTRNKVWPITFDPQNNWPNQFWSRVETIFLQRHPILHYQPLYVIEGSSLRILVELLSTVRDCFLKVLPNPWKNCTRSFFMGLVVHGGQESSLTARPVMIAHLIYQVLYSHKNITMLRSNIDLHI